MPRKLSPRQRDFLSRLLDLYREAKGPVHYAEVANALDVRPVTAYEMLRLLERKGLVYSQAVRRQGHKGRSIVVFSPTDRATQVLGELTGDTVNEREWEDAKASILATLGEVRGTGHQELLDELLLRIPDRTSPLLFATDMITAIILALYELRDAAAAKGVFATINRFGPPGRAVLYLLAGLSLALSLVEKANRNTTSLLLSYSHQFRQHLDSLTQGEQARLSDFVYEVLRALGL
jgi:predicted ArsR family transcriptional regulator